MDEIKTFPQYEAKLSRVFHAPPKSKIAERRQNRSTQASTSAAELAANSLQNGNLFY